MKETVLSHKSSDSRVKWLVEELVKLKESEGRVYRTTVVKPGSCPRDIHLKPEQIILLTTSKDIHLRLGRMSEEVKWALADHLKKAVLEDADGIGVILVIEHDDDGEDKREVGLFVTGGPYSALHLSQAS